MPVGGPGSSKLRENQIFMIISGVVLLKVIGLARRRLSRHRRDALMPGGFGAIRTSTSSEAHHAAP